MKYPDRYIISGIVEQGEHKGEKVYIYFSPEGGGWWQWGPEGWACRFENETSARFKDALNCASGKAWCRTGPWYYYTDPATVKVEAVPAKIMVY